MRTTGRAARRRGAGAGFVAALLAVAALCGPPPRPVGGDEPPVGDPGGGGGGRGQQPFLVRDTNAARYALEGARAALAAGETLRGVRELQRLMDDYADDVVRVSDDALQTRWISAPEAARQVLLGLPPEARRTYEEWARPTSEPLLHQAVLARDERALRSLAGRYGACSTGVAAARLLAESAIEAGRPRDAAAAAATGLRYAPNDPWLWIRRIDALQAAGDAAALAALRPPPSLATAVQTPQGPVTVAQRLEAARKAVPVPATRADWPQWDGGPEHDGTYPADHVLRPIRWSAGVPIRPRTNDETNRRGDPDDDQVGRFHRRWDLAPPVFPCLVDRSVYVNDGTAVYALDLYSGREAWRFPAPGKTIPDLKVLSTGRLLGRTNLDVVFAPSVDDGLVFASIEVEKPYFPQMLQSVEISTYLPRRVLVALDAATGALRWRMGESALDRLALDGISLAGPPTVGDGIVCATGVATDAQGHRVVLLAFDERTGRLRWQRYVVSGQQELNLFGEQVKELWAGAPAISEGVVYATSGLGVAVAADLRTGEVVWQSTYDTIPIQRVDLWFSTPLRYAVWGASPPRVHGDLVLTAPPEGPYLCAFDRRDGRLRWRVAAESEARASAPLEHLLGVHQDGERATAIVAGRGLRAIDLATGKVSWDAPVPGDVLGRGALTKTAAYVPTSEGFLRYVLSNEGNDPRLEPWPDDATPGNVFAFPRVLVVANRGYSGDGSTHPPVQAFFATEDLERDLEARRAARPTDPAVVLDAADLARLASKDDRAKALYEQAIDLAQSQKDPVLLSRAKRGLFVLHRDRADQAIAQGRPRDARTALEAALPRAEAPADRVSVRLRLDQVLSGVGLEAARIENLEALAKEGAGESAVFEASEGEVPARAAALARVAALHRKAGRPAEAVDALQRLLVADPDAVLPGGPARRVAKDAIDAVLAESGREVYRRHEAAAQAALEKAEATGEAAAYEELLSRWPNATVVPEALARLAERRLAQSDAPRAVATLRRLLAEYPEDSRTPRSLALLARALTSSGSSDVARATLARLERRHADATFTLDGRTWKGREFAQAERAKMGAARETAVPGLTLPLEDVLVEEVDPQSGGNARCLTVAGAESGGDVPILVTAGEDLLAIDPSKGSVRFRKRLGYVGSAAYASETLAVSISGAVVGLDPQTGEERWRSRTDGYPSSLEAAQGKLVALARTNGVTSLIAIDARSGSTAWRKDYVKEEVLKLLVGDENAVIERRSEKNRYSAIVHDLATGTARSEIPFPSRGPDVDWRLADPWTLLIAGSDDDGHRVDAWDLPTGKKRWSRIFTDYSARIVGLLVVGDDLVVLDQEGHVRTLAMADGQVRRMTAVTGALNAVPGVPYLADETRVFAALRDKPRTATLAAFDRTTGRAAWTFPYPFPVGSGGLVRRGDLLVTVLAEQSAPGRLAPLRISFVDAKDGQEKQHTEIPSISGPAPSLAVQGDVLVVAGRGGIAVFKSK
jgi:outer membrane protein assembly factor BamB/TolA-binding protein